jgi:hypothetical protein
MSYLPVKASPQRQIASQGAVQDLPVKKIA